MNIAVIGLGNIGTTIINIITHYKTLLGVDSIIGIKHKLDERNERDIELLNQIGVNVIIDEDTEKVLHSYNIGYVFDCVGEKSSLNRESLYHKLSIKASGQGSEQGFGLPYMIDINNEKIVGAECIHIVSCNTHGNLSILKTFGGQSFDNIISADFVCVRRSDDISNNEKVVGSNVISRHINDIHGTHHGIDVNNILQTIGVTIPITTSDITTPSQLMHSTRFHLQVKDTNDIQTMIHEGNYIGETKKFNSGEIFELGRRYMLQGRLYNHAFIVSNNLMIHENSIQGRAFIPQEGNTILSTIMGFLLQTENSDAKSIIATIVKDLIRRKV